LHTNEDDLNAVAGLFNLAGRLKRLKRQGWIDRGAEQPESVADHSWRLALMALVIAARDPEINSERAVRLALVHDLPEALAGDVTPFDDQLSDPSADRQALFHEMPAFSPEADRSKTDAERQALVDLTADLPADLRRMLIDAWEEYEANETVEAGLVRQLDKLETWLQALEYQQDQPELVIESFRLGTDRDVTAGSLRALRRAIDRLMNEG
jgi:putative hydrolases of HD superfamily